MIKKIFDSYKSFETLTHSILKNGLKFCLIICILSAFILLIYNFGITAPLLYYIGISLFRLSLIFGIEFIICSFVVDGIKKQII